MRLGYNTNGFAHHTLEEAIVILGELGYRSVAITVDHHALAPGDPNLPQQAERIHALLYRYEMRCVIETGARFLLDPWRKHQPTLLNRDEEMRTVRRNFLVHCMDLAAALRADAVSLWSGAANDHGEQEDDERLMDRLVRECTVLCGLAEDRGVRLAFEPEPGMFIDTMSKFAELLRRVGHSDFGLTLDVGHVLCLRDGDVADHVMRFRDRLWNVHIEDMRKGVHDHLMFGEGEMDFSEVFRALVAVAYEGPVHVELSRHSHDAVKIAEKSLAFLNRVAGETIGKKESP